MSAGEASLGLRLAEWSDAYMLWIWKNDLLTRNASSHHALVSWSEHVEWLGSHLSNPHHLILIAVTDQLQPIGVVRFDTDDGWRTARLSYSVAAEERGKGRASPLVQAGIEWLRRSRPAVRVRADVLLENSRSLAVFRRCGWSERPHASRADHVSFWNDPSGAVVLVGSNDEE